MFSRDPGAVPLGLGAVASVGAAPVLIAESRCAWTLAQGDTTGDFVWQASQLEAGWIPGVGWTPGAGTPNENLTLFDPSTLPCTVPNGATSGLTGDANDN